MIRTVVQEDLTHLDCSSGCPLGLEVPATVTGIHLRGYIDRFDSGIYNFTWFMHCENIDTLSQKVATGNFAEYQTITNTVGGLGADHFYSPVENVEMTDMGIDCTDQLFIHGDFSNVELSVGIDYDVSTTTVTNIDFTQMNFGIGAIIALASMFFIIWFFRTR